MDNLHGGFATGLHRDRNYLSTLASVEPALSLPDGTAAPSAGTAHVDDALVTHLGTAVVAA